MATTSSMQRLLLLASGGILLAETKRVSTVVTSLEEVTADLSVDLESDYDDDDVDPYSSMKMCAGDSERCRCRMTKIAEKLPHPSSSELLDIMGIPAKNVVLYTTGEGYDALAHSQTTSEFAKGLDCREIGATDNNKDRCSCSTGGPFEASNVKHCMENCDDEKDECHPICVEKSNYIRCYAGANEEDELGWGEVIKLGWTRAPFNVPDDVLSRHGIVLGNVHYCEPWKAHNEDRRVFCEWKPKGAEKLPKDEEALKDACKSAVPHRSHYNAPDRVYSVETMTCGREMKLEKCIGLHAAVDDRMVQEEIEGTPFAFDSDSSAAIEGFSKPCRATSERCQCTTGRMSKIPHPKGYLDPFNVVTKNQVMYMTGAGYKALAVRVIQDQKDNLPDYTKSLKCKEVEPDTKSSGRCFCSSGGDVSKQNVARCLTQDAENTCVLEPDYLRCYKWVNKTHAKKFGWTRSPFSVPDSLWTRYNGTKDSLISFCEPWEVHDEGRRSWCHWKPVNADLLPKDDLDKLKGACKAAVPNRGWTQAREYYLDSMTCGRNMKLEKCISLRAVLDKRFIADEVEGAPFALEVNS